MDEVSPDWPQIFIPRGLEQEASMSRSYRIPHTRCLALFMRQQSLGSWVKRDCCRLPPETCPQFQPICSDDTVWRWRSHHRWDRLAWTPDLRPSVRLTILGRYQYSARSTHSRQWPAAKIRSDFSIYSNKVRRNSMERTQSAQATVVVAWPNGNTNQPCA